MTCGGQPTFLNDIFCGTSLFSAISFPLYKLSVNFVHVHQGTLHEKSRLLCKKEKSSGHTVKCTINFRAGLTLMDNKSLYISGMAELVGQVGQMPYQFLRDLL